MNTWLHFVGGGASALHILDRLTDHPRLPGRVVVSEPNPNWGAQRTFSFWCSSDQVASLRPNQTWNCWRFSRGQQAVHHQSSRALYARVEARAFEERVRAKIDSHPDIEWRVEALSQPPIAQIVLDSRPPSAEQYLCRQAFAGAEVADFPATEPGLMTHMTSTKDAFEFLYTLPLDNGYTLVELTRFSAGDQNLTQLEKSLNKLIGDRLVRRRERAQIPMGLTGPLEHWGIPIGVRAGMGRASTGYSFYTAWEFSFVAAELLLKGQLPTYRAPRWQAWLDRVFLNLIQRRPELLPDSLMMLAARSSADDFAAFMTGNQWLPALKFASRAPKLRFVQASLGLL